MEYSLESIMAVGTGMTSRESAEVQKNGPIEYDGYSDGLDMDITRTTEQLHFLDTYDKLQDMHSAEKLKMIKKINAAYNGKTIGNTNVANSVDSFCNNAMSTEGVLTNVKEKLVEIFKRFCEFIKKCIMKFKMNIAKNYKLFDKVVNGLFIKESEKLIDKLYKLNSELIVKISHTSQITSDQKDCYLLIKSISDKMIQNCFNLFSIGVHDTKMMLSLNKRTSMVTVYNPKNLHEKLNMLIAKYDDFLIKLLKEYMQLIDSNDRVMEVKVNLKKAEGDVDSDTLLLTRAADTFKKITILNYDKEEEIREQIEQEESEKRKEEIRKQWEEDSKALNKAVNAYVSELEKRINTSFDEVRAANEDHAKVVKDLQDFEKHAEQVFNNIAKKR